MNARSCGKRNYKPPVRVMELTTEREIAPFMFGSIQSAIVPEAFCQSRCNADFSASLGAERLECGDVGRIGLALTLNGGQGLCFGPTLGERVDPSNEARPKVMKLASNGESCGRRTGYV